MTLSNSTRLRRLFTMLWITSPLQASPLVGECLNTNAINQEPITDLRETVQRATTQEEEDPTANYTVNDLWTYYFQCDDIFEDERPVHNESMWMLLRGVYQGIVGPAKASIAQPLSTVSGFYIDYDVDQTDDKGRGVFADQDIRKGQLVYTARRQMAKFSNGYEYRRFLRSIPADLACDVIQWAYVENLKKDNLTICCDLDEGSIINDGGKEEGNIGCDPEQAKLHEGGCDLNYFALRDIKKNEELLCIYAEFDVPEGWTEFGL